ncbi:MAG: cell division protein FtsA [Alphaproteobacteria bacterium]|nr:cell division protein FtsA [Alphaproteobacteria bacterium]
MSELISFPLLSRARQLPATRSSIVGVLDIGSSKLCCLIAKLKPSDCGEEFSWRTHMIDVIGIGHQVARGVKSGGLVDMDLAEQDIRDVVDVAERMACVRVNRLIVNVSSGRLQSRAFTAGVSLKGRQVQKSDVCSALSVGSASVASGCRVALHSVPIGFALDGTVGIRDPLGMVGQELSVDVHVASAESIFLRNLALCVNRCHLDIDAFVVTPYASGLSCLVRDEMELGITVIDMGAGTTSVSIFYGGYFVYCDVVLLGGSHVTADIARGLSTTFAAAERIKTLYGNAFSGQSREKVSIPVSLVGDDPGASPGYISESALADIIRPRLEEIFELVRDRLIASGFARYAAKRLVLTGGASQLLGVRELAQRVLSMHARMGQPLGIGGVPGFARGPSFSVACGLLVYPQIIGHEADELPSISRQVSSPNYLKKVGQWIKESF